MKELSKQTYAVNLTYNEIHIILNSLDEFIENNRHWLVEKQAPTTAEKSIVSIQNKLEPIHAKHNRIARQKLAESNVEVDDV